MLLKKSYKPLRSLSSQVLSSTVVCKSACECIMYVRVPQSPPELNLTLQSYEQDKMLAARSFMLGEISSTCSDKDFLQCVTLNAVNGSL